MLFNIIVLFSCHAPFQDNFFSSHLNSELVATFSFLCPVLTFSLSSTLHYLIFNYISLLVAEIAYLTSVKYCTRLHCCYIKDIRQDLNVILITGNNELQETIRKVFTDK